MHHSHYQEERRQLRATVLDLSEVSDIMIISPIFASPQNGGLEKFLGHSSFISNAFHLFLVSWTQHTFTLHVFPTARQHFKSTFPSRSSVRFLIPMRLYF